MQENNDNELLDIQENYALPEKKEVAIDLEKKETIDINSLSPLEMIRLTAKENKIELKEFPLKYSRFDKERLKPYPFDTGCRREGCMGRGYRGWEGNLPVPCACLFNPEHRDSKPTINRRTNRGYMRYAQTQSQLFIKQRAKFYGLTNSHRDVWVSKNGAEFKWTNVKGKWDFRRSDLKANENTVVDLDGEQ